MWHKIEWNGEMLSIRSICKKEGISEHAVYQRISLTGENPKTVLLYYLNQLNKGNREKIELNGKYLDVKTYCKQLNYDYKLVTRYKDSQPNKTYTEVLKEWENLSQDEIFNNIHLYDAWRSMLARCENPKHRGYKWYGGKKPKPVTVCKEWHDYITFRNQVWNDYIDHVEKYGLYQTTLDRKKTWYNYSYEECEWKDWEGQGRNKISTKYLLPCNNYQKTLAQHCLQNDYSYGTIINYVKQYNLEPHEALAKYLENKQKRNNKNTP